ncbi:MAG: B-box zinc finger protein [Chloroflexi bacterium]|nr:B-box zinc finger protein [Chloroflexota bacterium]
MIMKCALHPEIDAVAVCVDCGKLVCQECATLEGGNYSCQPCASQLFASKALEPTSGAAGSTKLTMSAAMSLVAGAIAVIGP